MKPAPVAVNTTANKPSTPTPKGFRLGRALAIVATLCGLLLIAVLAAPYLLPWFLQQQGIDFDWEKPRWQLGGFHASNIQLTLSNSDAELKQLTIDHLHIQWSIKTQPIQRLHVDHLQVDWPLNQDPASTETTPFKLPQALLRWLPQQLELSHIDANIGGLGRLQGSLKLHASANSPLWQPATIQTALSLKHLQGAWLDLIPAELQPTELNVHIATAPDHPSNATDRQLLELDMRSVGATHIQLKGLLDLQHTPHWQGAFKQAQLTMHLDELKHPNLHAEQLKLHAHLSAQANASDFSIQIDPDAKIVARNMHFMQLNAAHTQFDITDLSIMGSTAAPLQASIRSSFSAQAQQLTAPQLHPQNWMLTGQLNGQLPKLSAQAQLTSEHGLSFSGQLQQAEHALHGQLTLNDLSFATGNPLQATWVDWPRDIRIDSGHIQSQLDFKIPAAEPLQLNLALQAQQLNGAIAHSRVTDLAFNIKGAADLNTTDQDWQGTVTDAQLALNIATLQDPEFQAQRLQLRSNFTAQLNATTLDINFAKSTQLTAQQLRLKDTAQADSITLKLANAQIKGPSQAPCSLKLSSSVSMQIQQLSAAQLHTQNWDLNGTLNGALAQLALKADIHNTQGLQLSTTATLNQSAVQGQISLKDIFFKAGNPLQKTLTDWPDIMSFDSGKRNAQGHFTLPFKGAMALTLTGQASKLSGIVNRSELTNLDFNFDAQLSDTDLKLSIPNLKAEQLNPGIPISLMELSHAQYQAPFTDLLSGHLNWQHAQANVLNGRVWLAAQQLNLQQPQTVLLQVDGLELQELFRVYPAEGLSGTGTIDGQLPIHFNHTDFSINAGQLQARAPGVLQFQSDKINALGKTNPTMRIVADALEDFHFNVLSSGLSYDESGKLLLNVRLEGQNPDVEKGRPINLNVNLEEDIPALLASIQLSNQVSEIIQKRIRERLERR